MIGMERLALLIGDDVPYLRPLILPISGIRRRVLSFLFSSLSEGRVEYCLFIRGQIIKSANAPCGCRGRSICADSGDDEITQNVIILRDMQTKNQYTIPFDPSGLKPQVISTTISPSTIV